MISHHVAHQKKRTTPTTTPRRAGGRIKNGQREKGSTSVCSARMTCKSASLIRSSASATATSELFLLLGGGRAGVGGVRVAVVGVGTGFGAGVLTGVDCLIRYERRHWKTRSQRSVNAARRKKIGQHNYSKSFCANGGDNGDGSSHCPPSENLPILDGQIHYP